MLDDLRVDWQEIVDRKPKGYLELNDGKRVIHGPVESMAVNGMDFVEIRLIWAAKVMLSPEGVPSGEWKVSPADRLVAFPNLVVPFVVEETPEKGPRVRFGLNLLYLNKVKGLNPSRIKGLDLPSAT